MPQWDSKEEFFCEGCDEKIDGPDNMEIREYRGERYFFCNPYCADETIGEWQDSDYYENWDDPMYEDYWRRQEFADPGGNSSLRAETEDNPRIHPCPNCGEPNRLTPKDVALGYQCDTCADAQERGY